MWNTAGQCTYATLYQVRNWPPDSHPPHFSCCSGCIHKILNAPKSPLVSTTDMIKNTAFYTIWVLSITPHPFFGNSLKSGSKKTNDTCFCSADPNGNWFMAQMCSWDTSKLPWFPQWTKILIWLELLIFSWRVRLQSSFISSCWITSKPSWPLFLGLGCSCKQNVQSPLWK